jgi:hypothetical protein
MSADFQPKSSRDKVSQYRKRLRQQGMRPIQIWVPDVRSAAFRSEAHRQSVAVSASSGAKDDQAFVDSISEWSSEPGEG